MRRLIAELRARNVFKVATVYLVAGWVVMQVADLMFPALGLPAWTVTLVAALMIVGFPIALVLAWAFELSPEGIRRERGTSAAATQDKDEGQQLAAMGPSDLSVAVLPFLDLSAEHDQEYFADGLSEELLNSLVRLKGLRVASRTSCFALKGENLGLQAAARRLNVTHIVEGSVRKAGDQLRITGQLIEATSDSQLWAETYQRKLDDIFEIQHDIAQQIATALQLQLHPDDLAETTTDNVRAYDYYLRGRSYCHRFGPKNLQQAIQMFTRATEVDGNFARAWSGLGDAHAALALYYGGGNSERALADTASKRAVTLAPDLGETHTSRGLAHAVNGRRAEAEHEFQRAIELDSTQFAAYYQYARIAYAQGQMDKALELFLKAAEADPEDFQALLLAAPIHRSKGRLEESREAFSRGVVLAEKHLEQHPDNARAYVLATTALLEGDQRSKALDYAQRAIDIDPDDPSTLYNIACFYAQAGEPDKAMDCLEGAIHSLDWIEHDPDLDPLRELPRFKAYVRRLQA